MRKTTVHLTDTSDRRIRQAAKRFGVSPAVITRRAIDEFLDRAERAAGLPPSVGMVDESGVRGADDERWLAELWGQR